MRGGQEKEGSALFRAAVHVRIIRGKFVTADWLASFDDSFSGRTCLVTVAPFLSVLIFSLLFNFFFFPPFFFISSAISALPTIRRYSFPFLRGLYAGARSKGKLIQSVPRQNAVPHVFSRFLRVFRVAGTNGGVREDPFFWKFHFSSGERGVLLGGHARNLARYSVNL